MADRTHNRFGIVCAVLLAVSFGVLGPPSTGKAAQNDFDLSRFADFNRPDNADQCANPCGRASKNVDLFQALVTDFGQVMAPPLSAPSSTLGEAGFSVTLVPSVSFIPNGEQHWLMAVEGNTVRRSDGQAQSPTSPDHPSGTLFTPTLLVRKGLPFSFEFAGTMSHIAGSDMFTVGSQIKWALNEGFKWFPDVSLRGSVNTLVGASDLEMVTAGWDVGISKGFPIGGVLEISPYAGYQQLHVIGWSRLLNVYPQDPRAPQADSNSGDGVNDAFNPEFVFSTYHTPVNRAFIGTRINVWIIDMAVEGIIGEGVHQLNISAGLNF